MGFTGSRCVSFEQAYNADDTSLGLGLGKGVHPAGSTQSSAVGVDSGGETPLTPSPESRLAQHEQPLASAAWPRVYKAGHPLRMTYPHGPGADECACLSEKSRALCPSVCRLIVPSVPSVVAGRELTRGCMHACTCTPARTSVF